MDHEQPVKVHLPGLEDHERPVKVHHARLEDLHRPLMDLPGTWNVPSADRKSPDRKDRARLPRPPLRSSRPPPRHLRLVPRQRLPLPTRAEVQVRPHPAPAPQLDHPVRPRLRQQGRQIHPELL